MIAIALTTFTLTAIFRKAAGNQFRQSSASPDGEVLFGPGHRQTLIRRRRQPQRLCTST